MQTIDEFRPFVLRLMQDGQPRKTRQIIEAVCQAAGLSEEEKAERLASGQSRADNRIGWACTSFAKAGILERPGRAIYQITPAGQAFYKKWRQADKIMEKDLAGLPLWDAYMKAIQERNGGRSALDETLPDSSEESPESLAIRAVEEMENQTAVELLNRLRQNTPKFFEKAVIKVLLAMGYGGKENLADHVASRTMAVLTALSSKTRWAFRTSTFRPSAMTTATRWAARRFSRLSAPCRAVAWSVACSLPLPPLPKARRNMRRNCWAKWFSLTDNIWPRR